MADHDPKHSRYIWASDHGNTDAVERLAASSQPSPQSLSRQEHDTITESKLVHKRAQAKQRSERESGGVPKPSLEDGRQVVDVIRKNLTARHHAHGSGAGVSVGGGTMPVLPPIIEQSPPPAVHAMSMHLPSPAPSFTTAGISQSTSVHAGRPRCQLGSPPPSRTNSPSYARPAGRPTGQRPDRKGSGVASELKLRLRREPEKHRLHWYIQYIVSGKTNKHNSPCQEIQLETVTIRVATTNEAISNRKPKTPHTRNYYSRVCKVDVLK